MNGNYINNVGNTIEGLCFIKQLIDFLHKVSYNSTRWRKYDKNIRNIKRRVKEL